MIKRFLPTLYADSVGDIDLTELRGLGVNVLILDLDNTLVPHNHKLPSEAALAFIKKARTLGFKLHILSNNKKQRVSDFNESIMLDAVHMAFKPFLHKVKGVLRRNGYAKNEVCIVGDQIFTDILLANRLKVKSVLVKPVNSSTDIKSISFKRKLERVILRKRIAAVGFEGEIPYADIVDRHGVNAVVRQFGELSARRIEHMRKRYAGAVVGGMLCGEIMPHIEVADEDCAATNYCTAVKVRGGKLHGFNTVCTAFRQYVKENGINVAGKAVIVLGEGVLADSIRRALRTEGANVADMDCASECAVLVNLSQSPPDLSDISRGAHVYDLSGAIGQRKNNCYIYFDAAAFEEFRALHTLGLLLDTKIITGDK